MHYLICKSSSIEELEQELETLTLDEFAVLYSDEVDVKRRDEKLFLFQGFISNKEEVSEKISDDVRGDVELFQKCYENKEIAVSKILDGSYTAVVIINNNLELFRDVFGSKPVYFTQEKGSFALSSNIKPLLQARASEAKLNEEIAVDYLSNGLVDHRRETFFQGVKRLKPRESLAYDRGSIRIEESEYLQENTCNLRKTLVQHIENLKPEDTGYYCPVSGGLDSTITARRCGDAEHIHLSFQQGTKDDEYIEGVKSEYDLNAETVNLKPIDLIKEVEKTVESQEEPAAFPAIPAQSHLYRNVKDNSVVISGAGADELFYGYSWFLPFYLVEKIKERKPVAFLRELFNYRKSFGMRHLHGLKDILLKGEVMLPSKADEFVKGSSEPLKIGGLKEAREKHLEEFYLPHMLRSVEKNAESQEVEVRPAFLSKKLLKYSGRKDYDEHFQKGLKKYLLRSKFREELPEKIYRRKQKTGFVSAADNLYTEAVVNEFLEVFRSDSFQNKEILRGKKVLRALEKGCLPFETAYRFYNFEVWMQKFLD